MRFAEKQEVEAFLVQAIADYHSQLRELDAEEAPLRELIRAIDQKRGHLITNMCSVAVTLNAVKRIVEIPKREPPPNESDSPQTGGPKVGQK